MSVQERYDPLADVRKDEIIKRDKKEHEEGKDDQTAKRARSEEVMDLDAPTKKKSRIDDGSNVEKKLREEDQEHRAEDVGATRDQREPEKDTRRIEEPADMTMEEEDSEETIRAKVQKVLDNEVVELNQPSQDKRCLVLDIDYTIFDQHGIKDPKHQDEYARPYLHEFLMTLYDHYDFVIFSATSQEAIEKKLENMGVLSHEKYKICLSLNRSHMIHISKKIEDKIVTERAKPLKIIWKKFVGYGPHNTIHIDDKATNFQLNPSNGLLIEPYKDATNEEDKELFYLTQYLLMIAKYEDDFSQLDHKKWKEYVIDRLYEKQKAIKIPPHPIDVAEQDKATQQS